MSEVTGPVSEAGVCRQPGTAWLSVYPWSSSHDGMATRSRGPPCTEEDHAHTRPDHNDSEKTVHNAVHHTRPDYGALAVVLQMSRNWENHLWSFLPANSCYFESAYNQNPCPVKH